MREYESSCSVIDKGEYVVQIVHAILCSKLMFDKLLTGCTWELMKCIANYQGENPEYCDILYNDNGWEILNVPALSMLSLLSRNGNLSCDGFLKPNQLVHPVLLLRASAAVWRAFNC